MATKNFDPDDLADYDDQDYNDYEDEEDQYDHHQEDDDDEEYTVVEEQPHSKKEGHQHMLPVQTTHSKIQSHQGGDITKKGSELHKPLHNVKKQTEGKNHGEEELSAWYLEKRKKDVVKESETVFVVIGHVDAGKSTLNAQLFNRFGSAQAQVSKEKNRKSKNLAWEMDVGADERQHGVTIDAKAKRIVIEGREFVAIDAPGHADFVPSMLLGAMQADAAVLVIDCVKFDAGFSRGGQTKEHLCLIRSLGINQLVVVLNKIDLMAPLTDDTNDRIETIKVQLIDYLNEINFPKNSIRFVPCSAISGENLFNDQSQSSSSSLISALKNLRPKPHGPSHHTLCFPVADVNGPCISGRIECGSIHIGEHLMVLPNRKIVHVSSFGSSDPDPVKGPGAYIDSLHLTRIDDLSFIHPGCVLVDPNFPLKKLKSVESFHAKILVINDDFMPIVKGQTVTLNCHTAIVEASISRLVRKENFPGIPKCLVKGDLALVEISLRKGSVLVVEPDAEQHRVTGRVVIRDRGVTIAAGLVVNP